MDVIDFNKYGGATLVTMGIFDDLSDAPMVWNGGWCSGKYRTDHKRRALVDPPGGLSNSQMGQHGLTRLISGDSSRHRGQRTNNMPGILEGSSMVRSGLLSNKALFLKTFPMGRSSGKDDSMGDKGWCRIP